MNSRQHLLPFGIAAPFAFLLSLASCTNGLDDASPRPDAQHPNIIFIMADDLGYADLSSYGRRDYKTPNLDALAKAGIRFTQAYSIAPLCSPTRVGLMTGRYPARTPTGLWEPLSHAARRQGLGLSPSPFTLPMLIKEAGYQTALIGKWHLGWKPEFQPRAHGFDLSFGPLSGSFDYISHAPGTPSGLVPDFDHDFHVNGKNLPQDGYATDLFTREAVKFLENAKPPFFLSVQYTTPHWPWQRRGDDPLPESSTGWIDNGGSREIFADMVGALDEGVGEILSALDRLGLTQNTLVIFTSDNGGEIWSDMGPYRRGKSELWEGGIRVPAVARWPGEIPEGALTEQVVSTLDWTATMLSVSGATVPQSLDGIDVMPILRGDAPVAERTIVWRTHQRHRHKAVRSGSWKYLNIEALGERDRDVAGEYLFDLAADPGEQNNLKEANPDLFEQLKARYADWESEALDPIPLPN